MLKRQLSPANLDIMFPILFLIISQPPSTFAYAPQRTYFKLGNLKIEYSL